MLKLVLPIVLSAVMAGLMTGAATAPAAKKSAGKKAKAATKKPASKSKKSSKKSTKKGSSKKKPVSSWRTGQQQPTPERYREIQEALIARGHLQGPATGEWGPESVEALKKFQLEQNLKGDGKLDSLSLIALGLGPKKTANPRTKAQP